MNTKKYLALFLSVLNMSVFAKKMMIRHESTSQLEVFRDKHWLNSHSWFKIVPLQEILQKNPKISYRKITDKLFFDAPEFAISPKFPHKGYFEKLFTLHIPHGRVQGERGYVFVGGKLSDEMARGDRFERLYGMPQISEKIVKKVSGRVAVIAQHGSDTLFANYYHWICEVLGRLAIFEIAGIEYDWLYVGHSKQFMKETLELWGIDFNKVIEPTDDNFCIEADELIVPSMVINTSCGHAHAGNFQHPVTLQYVREKLLKSAESKNIDTAKFCRKIFISRKDSYNSRKILNEDEIFELFAQKGFERYELSKMSVAEQIILFHNAEIVVSEQSSGLTNVIFCKPGTLVIEVFQALIDNCFWWLSHMFGLRYIPIKTLPVDVDYFADFRNKNFSLMFESFFKATNVPTDEIKKIIETL